MKVLGLLILTLSALCTNSAAEPQPQLSLGISQAVLNSDWNQVSKEIHQFDSQSSISAVEHWLLGYANLSGGNYAGATAEFGTLDDPAQLRFVFEYAATLANEHPTSAIALTLKGDALARIGQIDEALVLLNRADQLFPDSALILDERGTITALKGDSTSASVDFRRAIELRPDFADAFANLGSALVASGHAVDAVESFTRAIKLAPDFALAINGRGAAYALMGEWDKARTDFERAQALMPGATYIASNTAWIELRHRNAALDDRGGSLLALGDGLERLNKTVDFLDKLNGEGVPFALKVPLQFAGPILQDIQAAQAGHFDPVTSYTVERVFVFELGQLNTVVGKMIDSGLLPATYRSLMPVLPGAPDVISGVASQLGRGSWQPSITEIERDLDGLNKIASAGLGMVVAGPRGAAIASAGADLAATIVRGATEPYLREAALDPVRTKVVQDWHNAVDAAAAHGVQAPTFTAYTEHLSELNFPQKMVTEFDAQAAWFNNVIVGRVGSAQNAFEVLRLPTQGPTPRSTPSVSYADGVVPVGSSAIAKSPVLTPNLPALNDSQYRLPASSVPATKPGGVSMRADVLVKGQQYADTSEFFGGEKSALTSEVLQEDRLLTPFLIFCAHPK